VETIADAFNLPPGEYQHRATQAFLDDVFVQTGVAPERTAGAMDDLGIPGPMAFFHVEATPYGRKTIFQTLYVFESPDFGKFFVQMGTGHGPVIGIWNIKESKILFGTDSGTKLDIHLQAPSFWTDVTYDTAAPLAQMYSTFYSSTGPIGEALFAPKK